MYQNPHASAPLTLEVIVISNTPDEEIRRNVHYNSRLNLDWVSLVQPHGRRAIICGGGPSLADHLDEIRQKKLNGGVLFAINGAAKFLGEHGFKVAYQVILDAKEETAQLVYPDARGHMFASQVNPKTLAAVKKPILWHYGVDGIEDELPAERRARGGYALVGGANSTAAAACCLAYVEGYRAFDLYGCDSSHRDGASHAYPQPMNDAMLCAETQWAGTTYTASLAMKMQAENFLMTAQALKQLGCTIAVHGDGLLPAMYNTKPQDLSERDKYKLLWQTESYRAGSPGARAVIDFLAVAKPEGLIVDFGCGTGRAGLALAQAGHSVYLVDFADNARDPEALVLPFLEWDLTRPMPMRAPFGFCCDVMEHIPPQDVNAAICNICQAAETVFFQISTLHDRHGALIGTPLHLTVKPHEWWAELFTRMGLDIAWQESDEIACRFLIKRKG